MMNVVNEQQGHRMGCFFQDVYTDFWAVDPSNWRVAKLVDHPCSSIHGLEFPPLGIPPRKWKLRIQFKLNTALLSYCPCVRPSVTGVTSHISHIYKGINAMLIIKPYIFWIKIILAIFLAKTRPDKTIFSALTNLTIYFDWSRELSKIWIQNPQCLLCLVLVAIRSVFWCRIWFVLSFLH